MTYSNNAMVERNFAMFISNTAAVRKKLRMSLKINIPKAVLVLICLTYFASRFFKEVLHGSDDTVKLQYGSILQVLQLDQQ
jgi:hypothetical protein